MRMIIITQIAGLGAPSLCTTLVHERLSGGGAVAMHHIGA